MAGRLRVAARGFDERRAGPGGGQCGMHGVKHLLCCQMTRSVLGESVGAEKSGEEGWTTAAQSRRESSGQLERPGISENAAEALRACSAMVSWTRGLMVMPSIPSASAPACACPSEVQAAWTYIAGRRGVQARRQGLCCGRTRWLPCQSGSYCVFESSARSLPTVKAGFFLLAVFCARTKRP